jgi:hypothetical protein
MKIVGTVEKRLLSSNREVYRLIDNDKTRTQIKGHHRIRIIKYVKLFSELGVSRYTLYPIIYRLNLKGR